MVREAMIALIDYGAGNIHSVEKALRFVGAEVRRTGEPRDLRGAAAAVLPGVGAFDDCARALAAQGMTEAVREFIRSGRPFLGICIGYQILFERSEEPPGQTPGLGLFKGSVVRFPVRVGLKAPQIGWNQIEIARPECPLFRGVPSGSWVYFVHSYYPRPEEPEIAAAWTEYGVRFVSAIWRENLFATQFHPEKSQRTGLRILRNFVELARPA